MVSLVFVRLSCGVEVEEDVSTTWQHIVNREPWLALLLEVTAMVMLIVGIMFP